MNEEVDIGRNLLDQMSCCSADGIPVWMAAGGLVAIILFTHLLLAFRGRSDLNKRYWTFNLLGVRWIKALVSLPAFPMIIQSISIALFALVIGAGLFGNQRSNIGPVLTWTWWWVLLIFFVLGAGKVFCSICPWEGISTLLTSLSLKSRKKRLGFELRWPPWARNIYPAMGLFILLTWFELGMDITRSPYMTAVMGIGFLGLAVVTAMTFERRAFCRYLCLVGRIQGLYALFAPVELRPVNTDVCRSCTTKDCYKGNETSTGCPTNLFPGNLQENTYCTMCTECVRACPSDNLAINLRPLNTDLVRKERFKWDEAVLAVVLLALTSFHGLTMTPVWWRLTDLLQVGWGMSMKPTFTLLMTVMILLPLGMFWAAAALSRRMSGPGITTGKIFKAFAYSVLPIALFYHVAHNGMHFFMEAQYIVPLLSDPFGWGWNLFGTANKEYGPLLSMSAIWWLQISMILIGHVYGVIVADRIAHRVFPGQERKQILRSLAPLMLMMILYSAFSVWLIAQPMEMRTGM